MISAAVVGGTGYTGAELLRLLAAHPEVDLRSVTSRASAGTPVAEVYPHLRGALDLAFVEPDTAALAGYDVVFFATPNGTAMEMAEALLDGGTRVIDLAADFRLRNAAVWERFYGAPHACPHLLETAVYGLPELKREAIAGARLVANPGCYPTAITLGFLPLVEAGVVAGDSLIADAKSGISGAGRQAKPANLLADAAENFRAYGVGVHRHRPEILQTLDELSAPNALLFVPHVIPMIRGLHATLYARLTKPDVDLQGLFEARYQAEPFVDVMPAGAHPETASVRGGNYCRLAVHRPDGGDTVVVLAVEDNLVKGAAGQAVQNMNIMFGLEETAGLTQAGVWP